jgi:bacterioferritin
MRELEATLTYMRNSFIMKDCDPSRVTEAIAVDEMRHMWWVGGSDNEERRKACDATQRVGFQEDIKSMLMRQIALETDGIEKYKNQIMIINDSEVYDRSAKAYFG